MKRVAHTVFSLAVFTSINSLLDVTTINRRIELPPQPCYYMALSTPKLRVATYLLEFVAALDAKSGFLQPNRGSRREVTYDGPSRCIQSTQVGIALKWQVVLRSPGRHCSKVTGSATKPCPAKRQRNPPTDLSKNERLDSNADCHVNAGFQQGAGGHHRKRRKHFGGSESADVVQLRTHVIQIARNDDVSLCKPCQVTL